MLKMINSLNSNQWTGFYMITASVMKGLNLLNIICKNSETISKLFLNILDTNFAIAKLSLSIIII